ncbi:hypothetical protein PCASD_08903 [Puccinia coronata f. sp. avenae]|nr:hypothetical protein PCASD_08903 [Puccinia coronata f. sp. avenae]
MILRVGAQLPELFSVEHGADLDDVFTNYSWAEMVDAWHQLDMDNPVPPSHHQSIPAWPAQESHHHVSANDEHLLAHVAGGPPPNPHLPFYNNAPDIHHHRHSQTIGPTITDMDADGLLQHELNFWHAQLTADSFESDNSPLGPIHHIDSASSGAPETYAGLHPVFDRCHTTSENPRLHNNLALPEIPNSSPRMSSIEPEHRLINKPSKKRIPIRKRILDDRFTASGVSAGRLQANSFISSDTRLSHDHLTTSLRSSGQLTRTNLQQQDIMTFDATFFAPTNPFSEVENAEIKYFQNEINQLPNRLLIFPKGSFLGQQLSFRYRNPEQAKALRTAARDLTEEVQGAHGGKKRSSRARRPDFTEAESRARVKLTEFSHETHLKSWYQRWLVTTGSNLEINPDDSLFTHFTIKKHKTVLLPFYLLYVEIICSIVRDESTTSKQIADDLRSARDIFISFTKHSANPAQIPEDTSLKWRAEILHRRVTMTSKNTFAKTTYPLVWTYLHHWMMISNKAHVFGCTPYILDAASVKEFFNNVFVYTYSSLYQKYAAKYST